MKRLICLFASFLLLGSICLAQQAAPPDQPTRDELMKMFDVLRVRQQTQNMMRNVLAQMKTQVEGDIQKRYPNLPPEAAAQLEATINDAVNLYPVNEMLDDLIPVYQKYLTKEDVDAVVGFYSSPAGQHFLDKLPTVTDEAMKLMMTKLQVRSAAYADKIEKQADELSEPKKN